MKIKMFHAPKQTNRWNKNQKVWIVFHFSNHSWVVYKFRGKGRMVAGVVDNEVFNYKNYKEIDVDKSFVERLNKLWKTY